MQETHFHCQAGGSRGSASHYWVCLSRTGPGGAGPQTAAAAAAAAHS